MKTILVPFLLAAALSAALANTAPTPVVVSAAMRPGTTLMDVVYRVNDPDDATVKVRALAFVDGVRSFAKVLRPVTFIEGTAANLGDAIPTNANHTLTWDVGADWNIDLGQVKFEILARDGRGLLAFDWISIPAVGANPALTISKDAPSDAAVLSALFWQYADGDSGLTLTNGVLTGNANSGNFAGLVVANGAVLQNYSSPFVFKRMNLDPAATRETSFAVITARAGLAATTKWHAINRPYTGISTVVAWGKNASNQSSVPFQLSAVTAIAAGYTHSLALNSDGTVVGWGRDIGSGGQMTIPSGLIGVTAIAAGTTHSLALKSDGTVVAWGDDNHHGQTTIPAGLTNVVKIAAGWDYSLALKSDGTVVAWGYTGRGGTSVPPGLTGVTAIAAGSGRSLALKSDGTVVAWGASGLGQPPVGLTGVIAIAAGGGHSLALKSDGTVVAWGVNTYGQTTIPSGLSNVVRISAGGDHSLALKNDGTVVAWGANDEGQTNVPAGLIGVTAIAGGGSHSVVLKAKAP